MTHPTYIAAGRLGCIHARYTGRTFPRFDDPERVLSPGKCALLRPSTTPDHVLAQFDDCIPVPPGMPQLAVAGGEFLSHGWHRFRAEDFVPTRNPGDLLADLAAEWFGCSFIAFDDRDTTDRWESYT